MTIEDLCTPQETEAIGAWLAGMTVGLYRQQPELYVGPARTLWVLRNFRRLLGIPGNVRWPGIVTDSTSRRR